MFISLCLYKNWVDVSHTNIYKRLPLRKTESQYRWLQRIQYRYRWTMDMQHFCEQTKYFKINKWCRSEKLTNDGRRNCIVQRNKKTIVFFLKYRFILIHDRSRFIDQSDRQLSLSKLLVWRNSKQISFCYMTNDFVERT